ncbi:phage tail tape measure protein [Eubacterium callanderi]|uniref:TP901 family phage tail tape measure protein n=1 Tax=Eubacterium callanderi TaxID=53442 RepID=E3GPF3_9FIRM|nr:phage tail tape measure protein [Eubacterium callanderi]OEZ05806.1 chromosome partition protein Smc [[Butyribacterium] methylotrophicum]ADO38074.1 TP901 family phage tail tape measure protein [Eubacterium callanderi]MCB6660095.1 phage tail tape measure protein [Eubacterium callanderi]MCB6753112.1 phage tail tape measure protein [Eubacterium callanderi]MCB7104730.1 phage tail tape measure protein [Eubacterium callanderi]
MAGNYAVIKVGANTSEFTQASKKMAAELKVINSEMKASEAEAKALGKADATLEGKKKALTQALNLQNTQLTTQTNHIKTLEQRLEKQKATQADLTKKVDTTTAAYKKAVATYGENSTEAKKLEDTLDKLKNAQKNNENAIESTENAINKATTSLNKMRVEVANNESALKKVNGELASFKIDEFTKKLDSASGKLKNVGDSMTMHVTAPIVAGGAAAVAAFNEVDEGADILINATGAVGEQGEELDRIYRKVAGTIPDSFDAIGGAVGEVNTRFGVMGDDLQTMSEDFLKFSRITGVDSVTGVRLVSRAMGDAGIETGQYKTLLDQLAKASQASGISVETLTESLAKYGAPMRQLGFDTASSIAIFAQWEKAGVNTEIAFSGMKKAISNWMKEGKDAKVEFSNLVKGVQDGSITAQEAMEIFGTKAGPDLVDAIQQGRFSYEDFLKTIEDSGGTLDNTFGALMDGGDRAKVAMNKIKIAGADAGEVIMESLVPILEKGADALETFAEWWGSLTPEMQEFIIKSLAAVAVTGPLLSGVGRVGQGVATLTGTFGKVVPKIAEFVTKGKTVGTVGKTAAGGVSKLTGGLKTLLPSLGGATSSAGSASSAIAGVGAGTVAVAAAIPGTLAVLGSWYERNLMVRDGSQAVIDKSTDLINKTGELNQSIQTNIEKRQGSLQSIQDEVLSNQGLVEQLMKLNDQYGGTTNAKAVMQPVVDELNSKIQGLNLSIDEETGKLSMTREEIFKVIDSYKQQAQAAEAYKQIAQNTDDLAAAEKNYQDLVANGKSIQEQQASVLSEIEGKYANVRNEQEKAKLIVDEYAWRTNDLTKQQLDNNKALDEAAGKVNGLRGEQSELISQITGEPVQAAEQVKADMYKAGGDAIQKYMDAMKEKSPELDRTAGQISQNAAGSVGSGESKMTWHTVGGSLGEALGWGYWSKSPDITQKANDSAQNAANAVGAHEGNFNEQGKRLGGGAEGGLASKIGPFGGTATNMAQTGVNAFGGFYSQMNNKGADGGRGVADGVGGQVGNVSGQFGRIKSVFDVSMPRPRIPLPVVHVSGGFSLNPPRVPHFSAGIEWFSSGGIFNKRSIIGVGDANNGVGDSPEAVVPLNQMYNRIEAIFRNVNHETRQTPQNTTAAEKMAITIPIQIGNKALEAYIIKVTGSNLAMTKRRVR